MRKLCMAFVLLLSLGLVLTSGCTDGPEASASLDKPIVAVSILPQAEFVEKIAGDNVKVLVMVPAGADPHTYEITSGQLRDLSKARMYVKVGSGLDFEKVWMDRLIAQNPDMLIVDSSSGITLRTMEAHDEGSDEEYEAGEYNESLTKDPHIWTSPQQAKVMVNNTYAGLVEIDPDNQELYMQNRDAYLAELDAADATIRETLAGKEGSSFIVYHPSWGYFADTYGLDEISVEIEGKEPSAKDMQRLVDAAKEKNVKVIFVQPGFSTTSTKAIAAEINAEVVAVDPLAKDYIDNLAKVTAAFEKGLA
ncbi:metal ABC transporter solute-binding protein, Zn/Mn family [Methanolobus chelungpuianus]|uniref:Zinc ABC transporter substrate-binding protein n=1 Tax=Methanolobus chelungpuianus TaxID=502115 RepID=A0AAE3HAQ5_9EURY|nr:zinc ABC transporter substrate-binding protein [Methanolobus chelungpuianus]MCQ6962712.1 zinc ABC transporter substrate-binding protein [Methanolobus chelungpuianus]